LRNARDFILYPSSRTYNAACTYVDSKLYRAATNITLLSETNNLIFKHVIKDQSQDANFLNKHPYFNKPISQHVIKVRSLINQKG